MEECLSNIHEPSDDDDIYVSSQRRRAQPLLLCGCLHFRLLNRRFYRQRRLRPSGRDLGALYPKLNLELLQWPAEVSAEKNVSRAIYDVTRPSILAYIRTLRCPSLTLRYSLFSNCKHSD